jgi:hypothetical protein
MCLAVFNGRLRGQPIESQRIKKENSMMSANLIKILFLSMLIWFCAMEVGAHEAGAPFSGAIPEPILLHHAHIEDEQKLNFVGLKDFRTEEKERAAFFSSLELAVTWLDDFRLGSEIFIPFSNTGTFNDKFGLGDIEIQPIKYAFLNKPETVITGAFSLILPTGDESKGLGEDQTALGGLLFLDKAYRNWYLGINTEYVASVSGPTFSEFEIATALAYSFIRETGKGFAPARPNQPLVLTLMLELVSAFVLTGSDAGQNVSTLLPGFQLWHPESNWKVRMGIGFPIQADKEYDVAGHFQVGKNFDWGQLFK